MPTKSSAKKKRPMAKSKTKKATAKPARTGRVRSGGRAMTKKTVKKTMKKIVAKKAEKKVKSIGEVVHYYDRIRVAIIELTSPLAIGDTVTFSRGEKAHTQEIASMQVEHTAVARAKKGDVVGVLVTQEVHDGAIVTPA